MGRRLFLLCCLLLAPAARAGEGAAAAPPRRIVSLAPSVTELLFALGVGDRVVGVTRYDDFPPAVTRLPKVGGFVDPDAEAVLALHPDLVVAVRTSGGRGRLDTLARLGATVLSVSDGSLDDLWQSLRTLGQRLGCVEAAEALHRRIERELAEATAAARPGDARRRALVVVGHKPLVGVGAGTFIDELLRLAGGENVLKRGGPYPVLDLEAVAALTPEVILDLAAAHEAAGAAFWQSARFVPAVARGRVVRLEDAALLRPGPRLPQGLRLLVRGLWSEGPG
jgi:iron complex transport system substrate-binding protein